jgi:hypothetical protein
MFDEDVLYNYIDASSMNKSKNGKPFWVAKEIHLMILQALKEICSQSKSLVVDLFTFIGSFRFLSFGSFLAFFPIFFSNFHAPSRQ